MLPNAINPAKRIYNLIMSRFNEHWPTTVHAAISSARQILQVERPVESDVQTELTLIRSMLLDLRKFAGRRDSSRRGTATLIFVCYWHYVERIAYSAKSPEWTRYVEGNDVGFLRWDRRYKLRESRELINRFWAFNYTLLSIFNLLGA